MGLCSSFPHAFAWTFNDEGGYGWDGYTESGVRRGAGWELVGKWRFLNTSCSRVGSGFGVWSGVYVLIGRLSYYAKLLRGHEN